MTMLWFEGWEAMDTATLDDYYIRSHATQVNINSSPPTGRTGQCLSATSGNYLSVIFPDNASLVMGAAVRKTEVDHDPYVFVLTDSGGNTQCSVEWSAGVFQMRRGLSTLLDTSTNSGFSNDTWYYVEWKVTVANSGTWEFKVDGVVEMSGSGDTQNESTDETVDLRFLGDNSNTIYWDDVYLLNQSGSAPYNDYLGDVTVETIVPDGAGNSTDWTPSAGSNFENVEETPHDSDTTYNSADTVSDKDLYTMGAMSGSDVTIYGVQSKVVARKEAGGNRIIRPVIRTGATDFEGDDYALTSNYAADRYVWEENPDTVAAWTISDVNGIEVGQKIES